MAGSINKTGNNKYRVRLYIGLGSDGKRDYHFKTINGTKKDAERYLAKVVRERDLGELVDASNEFLKDYLERWLEISAKQSVASSTFTTYSNFVSTYLRPGLGDFKLSKLSSLDIQVFYNSLSDRGLAPKTVKHVHSILRIALNQAVKWSLIRVNPALNVELPKRKSKEMQSLTHEQAVKFLDYSVLSPWKALFSLLLCTGMRPGEALGLKWGDLNLKNGRVSIQRSLTRSGNSWSLKEPKTDRSKRSVPLPPSVIIDLKELKDERLGSKVTDININEQLIFSNDKGEPIDYRNMYHRHFKRILKEAELPDIRLYDLRHTCATLLLSAGVNPKVVSERLGHADITLTLNTYSHVLPDMQDKATSKLEEMLFQNPHTFDDKQNNSHTIRTLTE